MNNRQLWFISSSALLAAINAIWLNSFINHRYITLKEGTIINGNQALLCIMFALALLCYSIFCLIKYWSNKKAIKIDTSISSVLIKKKNTFLGQTTSITVAFNSGFECSFYCSNGKVASALLSEFKEGQMAKIKINDPSGNDCSLTQKHASAYGSLRT